MGQPCQHLAWLHWQGNCVTCMGTLLYLREKQVDVAVDKYVDEAMEEPWIKQAGPPKL